MIKKYKTYKYIVKLEYTGTIDAMTETEARDRIRLEWFETDDVPDDCEIKVELDK